MERLEKILIILCCIVAVFTLGVFLGGYTADKRIEELAAHNTAQYQMIEKQKQRIRELQQMKQLKEIYG
ncbi:MAG: hypothetical protein ACTTI7_00335 [Gemella haemolysans]|uniref:hypothetical protein n=1 Tax=Gemella haemolysans TaxID=1379 RepID=UPI003F9F3402